MKLLLEWRAQHKDFVRNVHNDRHSARLREPKVQYDHSTGFRTIFWDVRCSADVNFELPCLSNCITSFPSVIVYV